MSWNFSTESFHIARKAHHCDAWHWVYPYIMDAGTGLELTPSEQLAVNTAKHNNGMINKGDLYLKVSGMFDGDWCALKMIPEIDEIAKKYDVYDEC